MAYLVLTHPGGRAAVAFDAMVADLQSRGWLRVLAPYALAVLTRGAASPTVQPLGDWRGPVGAMIGEIFDREALDGGGAGVFDLAALGELANTDPIAIPRLLADRAFGDYVGVVRHRHGGEALVFTDPLGGRPAFSWTRDGVRIIGDEPPEGLAAPLDVGVDWKGLADLMADPRRMGAAPPLTGVDWIEPGACRHGPDLTVSERTWSPAGVVRRARGCPRPGQLRDALDGVLRAFLLDRRKVLCEISGGLDSAIVATSLKAVGRPADLGLNFYRVQAEADERVYAAAAAERAGTKLRAIERPLLTLTETGMMAGAGAFRPNFEILDTDFDDFALAAIEEVEADIVFTGHGGDVVFYQLAAADLAADLLRGVPCEGSRLARLAEVSLRTRRSVWSLAAQALRGRPSKAVLAVSTAPRLLTVERPEGIWHPWMGDVAGLTPAKRSQIGGLALTQGVFAHTRRGNAARLCHPLLSQPVVETCLATPAPILSQGEGERSFARQAFADRLPEIILSRRSKGDISVFMGRTLAKNAAVLRDFLLDGRLVAAGVLRRQDLEAVLSPEILIFRNAYAEIITATVLEAFARYWEGRSGAAGASVPAEGAAESAA